VADSPESPLQAQIDFTMLNFPSDILTMKDLRRLYPEGFQHAKGFSPHHVPFFEERRGETFFTLVGFERLLALNAFDRALGRLAEEDTATTREDIAKYLDEFYIRAGIAPGPAAARQLLRNLETAAADQAFRHVPGKSP